MNRYLGVDPSLTSTGYAVLSATGFEDVGTIAVPPASKPLAGRLMALADRIDALVALHRPTAAVVEQGFSGGAGPTAWKLGAAAGAVLVALCSSGVPVTLVTPKSRAKLATGNGNAAKIHVVVAARERLQYGGFDDDEADAMWLAVLALMLDGEHYVELPKANLTALAQLVFKNERLSDK